VPEDEEEDPPPLEAVEEEEDPPKGPPLLGRLPPDCPKANVVDGALLLKPPNDDPRDDVEGGSA
jgi:hypothetical protein